jgi:hypothetical protein
MKELAEAVVRGKHVEMWRRRGSRGLQGGGGSGPMLRGRVTPGLDGDL